MRTMRVLAFVVATITLFFWFASVPSLVAHAQTYTNGTVTRTPVGTYNYSDALAKSWMFYEAQRSGRLPATNRIPFRGNSALNDGSDHNVDLTGGLYDAGDFVKFNFPAAYTLTVLAWGVLMWPTAYSSTGQLGYARDTIAWLSDYFVKCHTSDNVLWGQVGDPIADHNAWDRVETMTMPRPSYQINTTSPGTDLAAQTSAGLAAASLVFRPVNATYADILLAHARTLYTFANTYRGFYSTSIGAASPFYASSFYFDELALAAAWLYKATGESAYLTSAQSLYTSNGLANRLQFNWEDKSSAVTMLLLQLTNSSTYSASMDAYMSSVLPGGSAQYTVNGQLFLTNWGSLRASTACAMMAFAYADWLAATSTLPMPSSTLIKINRAKSFAINQTHFALGDSGFSYVIGFNGPLSTSPTAPWAFPRRPHHRDASCPVTGSCGWSYFSTNPIAPNILNGALVGGPTDLNGTYYDVIDNAQTNEVALDYNSAFTGAVARLVVEQQLLSAAVAPNSASSSSSSSSSSTGSIRSSSASTPNAATSAATSAAATSAAATSTAGNSSSSVNQTLGETGARSSGSSIAHVSLVSWFIVAVAVIALAV